MEVPGKTTYQTLETVDVAPMAGVQRETQGEAEEGEPPYKAARSGDIVMVIDGETFCVREEDVPKVYYEEDDGQVLPTEQVHEGMQRELQLMKDLEVSERIIRTDVPSGKKIWSTRWCHRRKGAGVRSRFVVRQFRDTDWETAFSGEPGLVVVRILLCTARFWNQVQCQVTSVAFMSTPLHDAEFIEPPIEAESDSRYVWKLRKALNGLKKASQLFSNNLSDILVDKLGFEKCSLAPTVFYHCETDLRTAIHVDDPLTIGEVDTVMRFYDSLKQWLLVRVQDVVGSMKSSRYLVCRYWRLGHCYVEAATQRYFEDAFARVGMTNCKSVVTPGVKRAAPAPDSQEARPLSSEEQSTYRQGVGKLQFIVERRPDLLYPLKEAGRQLANPREFDMIGFKRIMRNISGTEYYKLFLEMSKDERVAARTGQRTTVTATCDTDWAGCAETRRSTTCVCIDWGGFLITCFSRSQTVFCLS